ncbi:hypothetical protein ACFLYP_03500 [Chloroflexota bacterium]
MRSLAPDGQGWLYEEDIVSRITKTLEFRSERTIRGLLSRGMGIWWSKKDEGIIRITGLEKLVNYFEIRPGYAVLLPIKAFKKLGTFNAYLYASYFARATWRTVDNILQPTGGQTISVKKQTELFNACKTTILKWQKLANVKTKTQYAYLKEINESTYLPEHLANGKGISQFDIDGDGEIEFVYQIPNRLSVPHLEAHRTCLNRRLGRASITTSAEPRQRLYYDNCNALNKIRTGSGRTVLIYAGRLDKLSTSRAYEVVSV